MFNFSRKPEAGEPSLEGGRILRRRGEDESVPVFSDREKQYRREIAEVLIEYHIPLYEAVGNQAVIEKIGVKTSASDKEVGEVLKKMLAEEKRSRRKAV